MATRMSVLVFTALLAVMVVMYGLVFLPEGAYSWLIDEERPIEGIGALALLATSVLFFLAFLETRRRASTSRADRIKRLSLLILAIVFFVGFGEELSWGQRLLGFDTPSEIKDASRQEELNFHNLEFLRKGWLDTDHAFQAFWFGFGVLLPVGAALLPAVRRSFGRYLPVLPLVCSAAFVANQVLHDVTKVIVEGRYENAGFPLSHVLYETKESVVSLVFAVGALYLYRRLKERPPDSSLAAESGEVTVEPLAQAAPEGSREWEKELSSR